MTDPTRPLTLAQLNQRIASALQTPVLASVWVIAELSDFRINRGHAYMELIDKDESTGAVTSRLRAVIWASTLQHIAARFRAATGSDIATGQRVMVCGTVNYHQAFGMSFVISAIDPSFTLGEVERKRREIINRLKAEGIIDMNRSLQWPDTVRNIAVISAPGAAGYGDFIHQLMTNSSRLLFRPRLFPALMQGEQTVPSIIAALEQIASDTTEWDCVVIIRGGGATSDLLAFDDYNLAANIALYPVPVIIGIGHERDITLLDYVANMRVKTPTAAAEWLIGRNQKALDAAMNLGAEIHRAATARIAGARTQLAYLESLITMAPQACFTRAETRIRQAGVTLAAMSQRRLAPEVARIDAARAALPVALANIIARHRSLIDSKEALAKALSPAATLARGYSVTLAGGKAIRSADDIKPGDTVTTLMHSGSFSSTVTEIKS